MGKKIDYEKWVQDSLLAVVKRALSHAEKEGLSGKHHFYVTFATNFPGVEIPAELKEEYPDEITIVLQYEFWNLKVSDTFFSVTLSFHDAHENLTVPFGALISFVDPSVKFGLQFTPDFKNILPETPEDPPEKTETGSNVVSLDIFRRK